MIDYTNTLIIMKRYDNIIIPQIPEILTQYVMNHNEHYLLLVDEKWSIDEILKHIANHFTDLEDVKENYILKLLLDYFGISKEDYD